MGLVICPKHGNGFMYVCPHVVSAVLSAAPCPGVEYFAYFAKDDPELEGIYLAGWFCPQCVAAHAFPPSGTAVAEADGFFHRTSALYRPMCPGCFDEWREGLRSGVAGCS